MRVWQQDTEPYTAMSYAVWMLHSADFSDQWWGLLAIWTGHFHGMKFSTSGTSAFGPSPRRPHPNHGRKFVYDAIGIWHSISQHCLGIVGSAGLCLGNRKGTEALAAENIAGIVTQSRPSQQNCYGPQGTWEKNSIIMVLNKIAQKPVHGTTIVPHDGQQSSMMNEKHVQKKPGVDHPIASVDDLGAYEVAHESFFHKNSQVP